MELTGERFIPTAQGKIRIEHYHRYAAILDVVKGKCVLDVACGEGYGSFLMSDVAQHVCGVDISSEATTHAASTYAKENLEFQQGSATDLKFPDAHFDVVVSFETIEHLAEQEQMLSEIRRVLRPDGILVISSPNRPVFDEENVEPNKFHVKELDFYEFDNLLRSQFPAIEYFGQRLQVSSFIQQIYDRPIMSSVWSDDGSKLNAGAGKLRDPVYFIAFCGSTRENFPKIGMSLLYSDSFDLFKHYVRVEKWAQSLNRTVSERDTQISGLNQTVAERDGQLKQLDEQLRATVSELATNRERIEGILKSRSWRATAWLRWLGRQARRARNAAHYAALRGNWVECRRVRQSPLFDADFYARRNPDVVAAGVDLAKHYTLFGWKEHRNPSAKFSTRRYLEANPDVAAAGINPLLHYIEHGQAEGRQVYYVEGEAQIESIRDSGFLLRAVPRAIEFYHGSLLLAAQKAFRVWQREGAAGIRRRASILLAQREPYATYGTKSFPSEERVLEERREIAAWGDAAALPHFSILTPLYNTPEAFLREMIESVLAQTYENWELCLADGSDDAHAHVERVVREYMERDNHSRPRIVYKRLAENKGISENTNACLTMASGDYIGLLDHDDILHPEALYLYAKEILERGAEFLYSDEATFAGDKAGTSHGSPNRFAPQEINRIVTMHFKPDYAIDNLRANNYICHFSVFKKDLLDGENLFRTQFDGSQDHDMILRMTGHAKTIVHVPRILYYWRSHEGSVASGIEAKTYAIDAAKGAVADHLKRNGFEHFQVTSTRAFPTIFKVSYEIKGSPKVSIVIPSRDHADDLKRCIDSITEKSTWGNYEIVVVENNSAEKKTFEYYKTFEGNEKIRVTPYHEEGFNFANLINFGVSKTAGDYVLLLNNDTEVISADWMEELLMYAQRDDVGAVGAKLFFPDNTIQHAGVVLGLGAHRTAGHSHYGASEENLGYMGRLCYAQNVSAVTGACLMVSRKKFDEMGGLDAFFAVSLNDVDFCLRLRTKGYLNVFTPFAQLYHYESKSRGLDTEGEKAKRYEKESAHFRERWKVLLEQGDPYYNPNFSLDHADFRLRQTCNIVE